ncbi:MAG: hypothetical protein ACLR9W_02545 [Enterobacter hormaechei]
MLTTLLSILTNRILWASGRNGTRGGHLDDWPLLSIVDTRPLESNDRVISIAVVYLIWAQSHTCRGCITPG